MNRRRRPKDPKWHARIVHHKTRDNTPGLPPIVSSGDGGQPLFAFLSSDKFTTRKSKIVAIDFYTQYVNDHLESDDTTAGAFRITCSQVPDLAFEYIRPAWNMKAAINNTFRKLEKGIGNKRLQVVYDRHKASHHNGALEVQYLKKIRPLGNTQSSYSPITDIFDFCEYLKMHMKNDAKRLAAECHRIEEAAALRIQCRWRIRSGKLALHLKKQAAKEENAERDKRERAALRIQCAWRRRQGTLAYHLKKQAKKDADRITRCLLPQFFILCIIRVHYIIIRCALHSCFFLYSFLMVLWTFQ